MTWEGLRATAKLRRASTVLLFPAFWVRTARSSLKPTLTASKWWARPFFLIRAQIITIPPRAAKPTGRPSTSGSALRGISTPSWTLIKLRATPAIPSACCHRTIVAIICTRHPRATAPWLAPSRSRFSRPCTPAQRIIFEALYTGAQGPARFYARLFGVGGGPEADLLQKANQFPALARTQHRHRFLHIMGVFGKGPADQLAPGWRQFHNAGAQITWIGCAADEAARCQPVDCGRDRTAGQKDLAPDPIHRLRPLVQQHFQHGEIGKADSHCRNAVFGVPLNGPEGFKEHQPYVGCALLSHEPYNTRYRDIFSL